jgi:hypothetical protein
MAANKVELSPRYVAFRTMQNWVVVPDVGDGSRAGLNAPGLCAPIGRRDAGNAFRTCHQTSAAHPVLTPLQRMLTAADPHLDNQMPTRGVELLVDRECHRRDETTR